MENLKSSNWNSKKNFRYFFIYILAVDGSEKIAIPVRFHPDLSLANFLDNAKIETPALYSLYAVIQHEVLSL